ncbi:MAG TPA: MgtC/SapB family protein [Terriglobales bacterium]|nr:MgtC/SapB family protein [Terriglobales bacterium]
MVQHFSQFLPPPEGVKILIVLALSFLIGLEREEHKAEGDYCFGGVRTFPLIGLVGYAVALLSRDQLVPLSIGFAVVGAFLLMSYRHRLSACDQTVAEAPGVTTEISGLTTYVLGALVANGYFWIAATIAVASLFLLELKGVLEGLSKRLAPHEILTFTKFLALTAVVLPTLPNASFTQFGLNPFKTWLLVIAVCGISYGSYVLLALTRQRNGVLLSGVLGGAYSSTATTVALAKKASLQNAAHLFSGGILIASAMMYLRVTLLVMLFNRTLLHKVAVPLVVLACVAGIGGWLWAHLQQQKPAETRSEFQPRNPLELRSAILFAVLFLAVLVISRLVLTHFGNRGIYGLASLIGLIDVDAFILGMTQSAGALTPGSLAANSILIAIASNNVAKGFYAYAFADRKTGLQSLALLTGLAAVSLIPLLLMR